jgi:hypothetical protein
MGARELKYNLRRGMQVAARIMTTTAYWL